MSSVRIAAPVLSVLALTCMRSSTSRSGDEPARGDAVASDTTPPARWSAPLQEPAAVVASVVGLGSPESVLHDPASGCWLVSNAAARGAAGGGGGSIARLCEVGSDALRVDALWVAGGHAGAALRQPKGMALLGDTLWVADVDVLRGFDRRTGRPAASVALAPLGATSLSDVAAGPDDALYVTDSDVRASAEGLVMWKGRGRIYRVDRSGRASVALAHPRLANPSAIAWDAQGGRFVIAPMRGDTVVAWRPGDSAPRPLVAGPGWYEGVAVTEGGRVLVASSLAAAVYELENGGLTQVLGRLPGVGGIAYAPARGWLAVPLSERGRVDFYVVPPSERRPTR